MTAAVQPAVADARPPATVVRLTNMIVRPLLRSPAGRMMKPLAIITFTGRRTGSVRRVVVGWHPHEPGAIVLSPASWRANFEAGHPATVRWSGHTRTYTGTLETDPHIVADAVNSLLAAGVSPRGLALRISDGHIIDADDITTTHRALIRFEPTPD